MSGQGELERPRGRGLDWCEHVVDGCFDSLISIVRTAIVGAADMLEVLLRVTGFGAENIRGWQRVIELWRFIVSLPLLAMSDTLGVVAALVGSRRGHVVE